MCRTVVLHCAALSERQTSWIKCSRVIDTLLHDVRKATALADTLADRWKGL